MADPSRPGLLATPKRSSRCKICRHPARPDIDDALLRRGKYRVVARKFGLDKMAILRHHQRCMQRAMLDAQLAAATFAEYGHSLLDDAKQLVADLRRLQLRAENAGQFAAAAMAAREQRELLALRLQTPTDGESISSYDMEADFQKFQQDEEAGYRAWQQNRLNGGNHEPE